MVFQVKSVSELLKGRCDYVVGYVSTDKGEAAAITFAAGKNVSYIDLTLSEMEEARALAGFMPQSVFRIGINGSQGMGRQLEALISTFGKEGINVAVINDLQTKVLSCMSDLYTNPPYNYPASIVRLRPSYDVLRCIKHALGARQR